MPCKPSKVRKLLKDNKAKVVKRTPFIIQLLYGSSGYKQSITLGVDAGSKTLGLSTTTEKEVLFEAEVKLRTNIVDLLATRREYRRTRRNRKTRYRKPRFSNRKRAKGWLTPSIENRIISHLKAVEFINKILPLEKIVVEVAQFDIQKIKNPSITGVIYQQGDQFGFWNIREYVLWRDNHICQACKNKNKDQRLNVHHIESRKTGGNAPNNLITLCKTCHDKYHSGKLKLNFKRGQSFRDAAFMGIMRWAVYNKLKEQYQNANLTYGYITKHTRIQTGLEKSHRIDARCISGNPIAVSVDTWYYFKQVRGQNRQLHKANPKNGIRQDNKADKYVHGFQLFDKVLYEGKKCFVWGRRRSGYFDLRKLDGTKIHVSASYKKLKLIERAKTFLCERRQGNSSPTYVTA
jgi:hypothetical protein